MQYEEAVQIWGARRLATATGVTIEKIDLSTIGVDFEIDPGYDCCGGKDPHCYCSFAESPSLEASVYGKTLTGKYLSATIEGYGFDFISILREICEVDKGGITA